MIKSVPGLVLLLLMVGGASAQKPVPVYSGITWEGDWDAAFARAKKLSRPVMIGVVMDKQAASLVVAARVWLDPRVIKKSREFVNVACCPHALPQRKYRIGEQEVSSHPLYPGVTSPQVVRCESRMRRAYLGGGDGIAPLHLFTDQAGKLLFKQPYQLTADRLLALMDKALRMQRGEPVPAADSRPAGAPGSPDALTAEERRLLRQVVGGPLSEKLDAATRLLAARRPVTNRALVEVLATKAIARRDQRLAVLRHAGDPRYAGAAEAFTALLRLEDVLLRNAAVVTLEEMGGAAAAPALLEHWKREKDPRIRKDVLRALGPCGRESQPARALLLMQLAGRKSDLRAGAALGLGSHLKDAAVRAALRERYRRERGKGQVKLAVLWAYLRARDKQAVADVAAMQKRERNAEMRQLGASVTALVTGRPLPRTARGKGRGGGARGDLLRLFKRFEPLFEKDRVQRRLVEQFRKRLDPGRRR